MGEEKKEIKFECMVRENLEWLRNNAKRIIIVIELKGR